MKAAVLFAANKLNVTQIEKPVAGPGDLVIKVKASAICGTDGRIVTGKKTKGVRYPSVIGHEFSGEVVEVGTGVTNFQCGDAVAVDPVIPCCSCVYCLSGKENVCKNRQAIGYEFDGAFAEYLRIPAIALKTGNVFKVPQGISFEAAALAEPLACCINGQKNVGIELGDTVVILGAGPIGLMHIMLARLSGAKTIIVSELNEKRRLAALDCGADLVVDSSKENLDEKIKQLTDGMGADVVIMAIGVPALVNPALSLVRKGGRVNLFAGFSAGDMSNIDVNLIHYNELSITGASALSRQGYQTALNLISSGKINVEKLVTHRFKLDDINAAFACALDGAAIKILITNDA
ncbi:zinc-dependent dehydrogenase [Zophobihabitans entericus]|uniref:Alcohol dehydrogenase catalytic domain-containing protein n=1 Tax=Zophobihabitans entericus TaxID=1635327 RepID=A0A6G9IEQ7_9GAMM|nr:zinc-dependent dehydrogenase [Zophobihabitans entericus]QIQ22289.1 alcohol dehydrogenase catalytic domain-containing protein [Zophobihabitans entericus]